MKHKLVKRVLALALSFTLVMALFVPVAVNAEECGDCFMFNSAIHRMGNPWEQWSTNGLPRLDAFAAAGGDRAAAEAALVEYIRSILEQHRGLVITDTWPDIAGRTVGELLDADSIPGGTGTLVNLINGHAIAGFSHTVIFVFCDICGGDVDPDTIEVPDIRLDLGLGEGILYNLLELDDLQVLEQGPIGETMPGIRLMTRAGVTDISVVPSIFGGNALHFANRANLYAGFDFTWPLLRFTAGEDYTIQVIGRLYLQPGAHCGFIIAGSDLVNHWIGDGAIPDDDGYFVLTETFTITDDGEDIIVPGGTGALMGGNMRFQTDDPGTFSDFTIYQIAIVAGGPDNLPPLPERVDGVDPGPGDDPVNGVDPGPGDDPVTDPVAGQIVIVLTVGSYIATVNGVEYVLEDAPFVAPPGRIMIPFRFIADHLPTATVRWQRPNVVLTHPNIGVTYLTLGVEHPLALPGRGVAMERGNRLFVPARLVSDLIGGDIGSVGNVVTFVYTLAGDDDNGDENGDVNGADENGEVENGEDENGEVENGEVENGEVENGEVENGEVENGEEENGEDENGEEENGEEE